MAYAKTNRIHAHVHKNLNSLQECQSMSRYVTSDITGYFSLLHTNTLGLSLPFGIDSN